jgi:rod shape-determining protein MreC
VAVTRPRPRSARLLVVVLVSLSLAVITVDYREGASGPLAGVGRAAQEAMAPLQSGVTSITRPVGNFLSGLAHLPSLQSENQQLKEQVADMQAQQAQASYLTDQVSRLSELLQLRETLDPSGVPAVVIAQAPSNFDYTVTIDKGTNDGVQVDEPVVAGGAATSSGARLVGHVVSVTPVSASVELIIDRHSAVAGILSGSQQTGLVTGQGEQDLKMDGIEQNTQFDLAHEPVQVFTVSYQVNNERGLYPPGLLIGSVSQVFQGTNELQTSVSVRPAVDFSSLEYVMVLTTSSSRQGSGG